MASVCVGCGLKVDSATGKLIAATSTWPWACPDTNGAAVYCSADGNLRVDPPYLLQSESAAEGATMIRDDNTVPCTGSSTPLNLNTSTGRIGVSNNSACRTMLVELRLGARLRFDITQAQFTDSTSGLDDQHIELRSNYRVNGGPFITHQVTTFDLNQTSFTIAGSQQDFPPVPFTIAPGATAVIDTQIAYLCTPGVNNAFIQGFLILNQPAITAIGRSI